MSFTTRVAVFAALSLAGVIAWQWTMAADSAHDVTSLAVQQFHNSDAIAANLQQASLGQNWWPLVWPALWALLACVMFWDDVEQLWKHENT
jgi:hypothetical protein